ncbi:hypothetical protein GUITHDRAFT_87705 [Guillardia theta CCMP2712]|uniref:Sulfate exporter family transporter n=2 Tax=Guillardia theta TaxID=55529 RepID=L1J683_GUITC|nr:hypothetical protein GUITHDRAFT_87705 [Guillardia theta CCMP2712]EKX43605.1 hypothetical protein GUITHDRAFT_87705 [Guillardia theta CCMP2712]|eukprot:XP_005830585.1 hypothetical protein GUITHDRAFT_87705 [Guillardia theta CCMP2712]
MLPGVASAAALSSLSYVIADKAGVQLLALQGITGAASPISGIPVAILLGLGLKNFVLSQEQVKLIDPGLKLSTSLILRTGIVCIGAKLSAMDILTLGSAGIPAVVASITTGLLFIPWLGKKMGLPPHMSSLIAAGTSICGVTAISALAPVIKANQQDVSFAVANVVMFGTLGMLMWPYLSHSIFLIPEQVGIFLGLAVHDTSQVMGAALTYKQLFNDDLVFRIAAVTKLTRNIFLAAAIPFLALQLNAGGADRAKFWSWSTMKKSIPGFVLAFLFVACLRSIGDHTIAEGGRAYGLLNKEEWTRFHSAVSTFGGHYCLGVAMAAVGLGTSLSVLKGVGYRAFLVGFAGSAAVSFTAFSSVMLLTKFGLINPHSPKDERDELKR